MIAYTWKFAEVKEILFALLLILICFTAIDGAPINTISTEQTNGFNETNEHLSVVMLSYPTLKRLTQYFTTLNNKDLLSARGSCKSFHELASKLLNVRNKPLIITNGIISSTIDQQIFSTYKKINTSDFLKLQRWQPEFALLFDDCNKPTLSRYMPFDCLHFQIRPYDNRFDILLNFPNGRVLGNNLPRNGVIIPKMRDASVNFIISSDRFKLFSTEELKMLHKAKFIIAFGGSVLSPSDIELDINSNIVPHLSKIQSVSICYAFQVNCMNEWGYRVFLLFSGSNVETSTFLVETTNEEKLREKLLKWKSELNFLESHHIIPFHFTKESMEPANSESIFREIFGIQPATLRLSASELAETGLIYCNSPKSITRNPSSVFAIVGYKKFGYITTNL
ncbi:hypothetical protein X798_06908 [Onchocerca flexuosa]|uniref:F-box domain-containing protein n=1 Tax=Onchocerca flexuosa TaxID=387005 RepID=A0A238BL00_9BILA|nr:hypothetical protein X798_06908 [Onchocerca flexuosa]